MMKIPPIIGAATLVMAALSSQPANAASPSAGLKRLLAADANAGFSGVVFVSRNDRLLIFRGYGRSPLGPIRASDRFWLASTGKQFAAAAIIKLASEHRLRLDDPLRNFFATPPDKANMTVRQLLSHTSGLGQSYVSEEQTNRRIAVERMLAEPLAGPPGSGFRYSNSNIQLAAAIVEVVSGTTYQDYVRRRLWKPSGLRATGFAGDPRSSGVTPIMEQLLRRLRSRYWGEQGVYSNASDLNRWYASLVRDRILPRLAVREMFAPVVKIGEGYAGLGWFLGKTARGNAFRFVRGNEDFGANSLLYAYPDQGVVMVVLTHGGDADEETSWSRKVQRQLEGALGL